MEGIVGDVQLSNTNYLTHNRPYSKVGSTGLLASDPAMVHFGGFQLGEVYKQTLRIRNTSTAGTRVHIIPPTTPFFKARCDDKKGLLAPGMAEQIEVEFCPMAYKYYYDCIKIHSEGENLLVPLHGYPVMNETKFPKRVDFGVGKVALGDRVTKRYKMECKVPIDFEFEIMQVKPNASFQIEPCEGVVPAHGHITISITFQPLTLSTQTMELEVRVAEFNSQPLRCIVTGAASPGLAKERIITAGFAGMMTKDISGHTQPAQHDSNGLVDTKQLLALTMEQLDGGDLVKATKPLANKGGGSIRGGAGGGDAYTVMLNEERKAQRGPRDCRMTGPITTNPPRIEAPPTDVILNGVCVPRTDLTSTADVTYVLNQQPGKLSIKDVKDAIRAKQKEQEVHRAALESIMAQGMNSGVHPLERPEVPAHIKAALFAQLLSQAEESARRVALGSGVQVGHDIMGAEEVAEAQRLREDQHTAHQLTTEHVAAQRLEPLLEPAGALHLPLAGDSENTLSGAAFAATARSTDHLYSPAWRLIEADDLEKRAASQVRFQRAVWRTIYTARLRKCLLRIQGVLAQLGWDKQRLAEESANPVLLISEADRPGTAPTKYLKPDNVRTRPLPLYRDINFTFHKALPLSHYTDFDELGPQKAKEPLEYRVLGYSAEEFPGLTPYTPLLLEQPLQAGAVEERYAEGLQPCGRFTTADCEALPSLPDGMKQAPFTTLEIGNRYTADKVFAMPEPSWGMDAQYQIQPALFPYMDSTQHEVLPSGCVRALRGVPSLSGRWLPRQERWAAQLTPEVLPGLLHGPDPADVLHDSPDDADKPAIKFTVPSDDDIASLLPVGMPNMLRQRPSASVQAASQGGSNSQAVPQQESESQDTGPQVFELMRQRRQRELDSEKRSSRTQLLSTLTDQLQHYNSTLNMPCVYAGVI